MFGSRLPGVVKSTAASQGEKRTGTPRTVGSIVKMEHYLVTFYDELGDEHVDVLIRLGDQFFASPFGEEWCARLRPSTTWLGNEVNRRVQAKEKGVSPESIPAQDSVNVTGSRIIEGTKKILEQNR